MSWTCCVSAYSSSSSGISSLLGGLSSCLSPAASDLTICQARPLVRPWPATRSTAAKSGRLTLSLAREIISGQSAKKERPSQSVTDLRMSSAQGCRACWKRTCSSASSSFATPSIAPTMPASGSGSSLRKLLRGRMNSEDNPNSTTTVGFLRSQEAARPCWFSTVAASGKQARSCWPTRLASRLRQAICRPILSARATISKLTGKAQPARPRRNCSALSTVVLWSGNKETPISRILD